MNTQKLVGQEFGRWTVISYDNEKRKGRWICQCSCGNIKSVEASTLKNGTSLSCGCFAREKLSKKFIGNKISKRHGLSHTKYYNIWHGIKLRCLNEKDVYYPRYGGRGIKIFEGWINSPETFINYIQNLKDAEYSNSDDYSLDRIDNNGNYEPGNLRWATKQQQARNRRNNILSIEIARQIRKLDKMNISKYDIADIYCVTYETVCRVINNKIWKDSDE